MPRQWANPGNYEMHETACGMRAFSYPPGEVSQKKMRESSLGQRCVRSSPTRRLTSGNGLFEPLEPVHLSPPREAPSSRERRSHWSLGPPPTLRVASVLSPPPLWVGGPLPETLLPALCDLPLARSLSIDEDIPAWGTETADAKPAGCHISGARYYPGASYARRRLWGPAPLSPPTRLTAPSGALGARRATRRSEILSSKPRP